ncbi:hypothetical protein [Pseudarthrobacter sp. fls2-241-R2A-127]|uniref:hypothetical protein n=1 Tax=Pseudarthrobacter sp. fls2-241-R2A-127 TaxID=3040303 RepID=UPI002552C51A|nr:hypothetical protein [Pseudarthrobacter sp. fls2-241-R2A-127]
MTHAAHGAYAARLTEDARASEANFIGRAAALDGLGPRPTMRAITSLVAMAIADEAGTPGLPAEQAAARRRAADAYAHHLAGQQDGNGLFSSSGNLASPPDTSFTINDLCHCLELLQMYRPSGFDTTESILRRIARKAAPSLVSGGVHTPNHRWELASALAALAKHALDGPEDSPMAQALIRRAGQWLSEGVDIDADGQYSERSGIYAAEVTNPSLMALARDLGRPELLDFVRRNLHALAGLVEADGEIENVHSRRQDQKIPYDVENLLTPYRALAILDGNAEFSRLAAEIEGRDLQEPERHLAELLRTPEIGAELNNPEPRPADAVRYYPESRLLRITRGELSATLFAGSDFAATNRIGSGLANSATLLRARIPGLVLRSLRISPAFFSMGSLRPQDIRPTGSGAVLTEHRTSGYYGHLGSGVPPTTAVPDAEGRFFAIMAFDQRERVPVTLTSTVAVDVSNSRITIDAAFEGPVVPYTLELVCDGVPEVSGAEAVPEGWWLRGGKASIASADAGLQITVDPVQDTASPPVFDDGEMFTYMGGNDSIPGTRLLISGSTGTPQRLVLDFKPSRTP